VRTITAAELRQNLTKELRALEHGEEFVITRDGREIGRLIPRPTIWVSAEAAMSLYRNSVDPAWAVELQEGRDAMTLTDPWADAAGGHERDSRRE
jgi:prevent-host-death family protein